MCKIGVACLSLARESPTELLFPEILNPLQMDLTIPKVQFSLKQMLVLYILVIKCL